MVFFAGESLAPAAAAVQVSIRFFFFFFNLDKGNGGYLPFLLVTFLSGAIFLAFYVFSVNCKLVRSCKAADADFFFFFFLPFFLPRRNSAKR